ncbi:MAG: family 43 glycosylhydrolase, partial [Eubacterium sp.]|nr:family 43 glycosylhydrolase [Eubacterium sp.]
MVIKKLISGLVCAALIATSIPTALAVSNDAEAATTTTDVIVQKTEVSNPILGTDNDGNLLYGGDPSIMVDGDTVYLYTGRDSSLKESYYMLEWQCYSTKDLKNWKNEGVVMKANKASISWANTGTDAWAGQVCKYKNKYYFYYCTWDKTSAGQQSIGVAVSDSPTGPFTDKGEPLVKGTFTTDASEDGLTHSGGYSTWNDIDPTVWIETDEAGVEHRYLNWGNGRNFTCELNEDMITVKDINGDGKITFGTQKSGATSATADVIEMTAPKNFTEAPYLYRRQDENGKYYGPYYLFYAYSWREQMAYATMDASNGLMNGTFKFGSVLMPPTATSNTNHPAVFDFKGKTYFVYHNGSLPGGSGFRRTACITELKFNENGSIQSIPETTIGITGDTPYTITSSYGELISHEAFDNDTADSSYPYKNIKIGLYGNTIANAADGQWAILAGKADASKANYVSIASENKPGLYFTANADKSVTLAQDSKYSSAAGKIVRDEATAKAQTFRTVAGLSDSNNAKAVSFESVAYPGQFITISANGYLELTDGSNAADATFLLSENTT